MTRNARNLLVLLNLSRFMLLYKVLDWAIAEDLIQKCKQGDPKAGSV